VLTQIYHLAAGFQICNSLLGQALWMAERLVPLLATQVARVRFPGGDLRLEWKRCLFSLTLRQGSTFSSTAIEIIKWVKKFAVAQAKVTHILRPGTTAFKEQLNLLNGFER
jgi:hypothetical protein